MITVLSRWLFRDSAHPVLCKCGTVFFAAVAAILTIALNLQPFIGASWSAMSTGSLACIAAAAVFCFFNGRRRKCRQVQPSDVSDKSDGSDTSDSHA